MDQAHPLKDRLEIDQVCLFVRDMEKAVRQLGTLFNVGSFRHLEYGQPDGILHGKETSLRFRAAFA